MTLNEELRPATSDRVLRSLALRTRTAGSDAFAAAQAQIDNGDEARYSDKSGTYTKGVCRPASAWSTWRVCDVQDRAAQRFPG